MKEQFKVAAGFVAWLLLVVGLPALIVSYYHRRDQAKEAARLAALQEQQQQKTEKLLTGFADSHHANRDWRLGLSQFSFTSEIYSYQLRPVLLANRGRPLVFVGELRNISEEDGKPTLYLETNVNLGSYLRLTLATDSETASRLSSAMVVSGDDKVAVVAEVDSVESRPSEDSWNADKKPISLAKGRCIDALPIGEYRAYYRDIRKYFKAFKEP